MHRRVTLLDSYACMCITFDCCLCVLAHVDRAHVHELGCLGGRVRVRSRARGCMCVGASE